MKIHSSITKALDVDGLEWVIDDEGYFSPSLPKEVWEAISALSPSKQHAQCDLMFTHCRKHTKELTDPVMKGHHRYGPANPVDREVLKGELADAAKKFNLGKYIRKQERVQ